MFNSDSFKDLLIKEIDQDFYSRFHQENDLTSLLFKKLSTGEMSIADKKAMKLIIEHHIQELSKELSQTNKKDIFHENDSIDGVLLDLSELAKDNKTSISGVFDNDFTNKSLEYYSKKFSEISERRANALLAYFEESKDWGSAEHRFELPTIKQVSYEEDSDYNINKEGFTERETQAYQIIQRHLHPETKFEPVRFIGDKLIALDFEDIGYHIKTTSLVGFYQDLIDIENEHNVYKKKYNDHIEIIRFNNNVSFILEKSCEHLTYLFGHDFISPIIEKGRDISQLLILSANSNGAKDVSEEILKLLSEHEDKSLFEKEFVTRVEKIFKSVESVNSTASDIRSSMFSRVNMEDIEKDLEDFDIGIEKAIELKNSGDTLSFKRQYNSLNVFQKISVDLHLNEYKTKDKKLDKDNQQDINNVISL